MLFVDDEPSILRALVRTLKHPRCRFVTTLDPTTALDLIVKEKVDVLFSDVDMPQMSGLDLVRTVRDTHPHVVRMMLTAGRSLTTALSAINDGGVLRFMLKPWEDDVIRAALGEALGAVDEVRAGGATRPRPRREPTPWRASSGATRGSRRPRRPGSTRSTTRRSARSRRRSRPRSTK